jgi:predicted dehydrogenase
VTPLPVVVAGAGLMGRAWLACVEASPDAELTGVADLDVTAAREAVAALGRPDLPVGDDVVALARRTGARAVIDVTVPAAHHPVTMAALFAGLAVLGEKPAAQTVAEALSLAAASDVTGQLFMVSQSRRWNPQLHRLREMAGRLGAVGTVTTEFFRAPHFGGFREQMAYPLLVDMAIHHFDAARFVLGAEPVEVVCRTHNPPWSWFAGDADAAAVFAMAGGARYVYTGSWCSPGAETSWNGSWRVAGEHGAALWDGDTEPRLDAAVPAPDGPASPYSGIAGALAVFADALRTGVPPMGEVHENLMSLAMVEAAVESARSGTAVRLDDVLRRAWETALRDETRADVRAALAEAPPG